MRLYLCTVAQTPGHGISGSTGTTALRSLIHTRRRSSSIWELGLFKYIGHTQPLTALHPDEALNLIIGWSNFSKCREHSLLMPKVKILLGPPSQREIIPLKTGTSAPARRTTSSGPAQRCCGTLYVYDTGCNSIGQLLADGVAKKKPGAS